MIDLQPQSQFLSNVIKRAYTIRSVCNNIQVSKRSNKKELVQ